MTNNFVGRNIIFVHNPDVSFHYGDRDYAVARLKKVETSFVKFRRVFKLFNRQILGSCSGLSLRKSLSAEPEALGITANSDHLYADTL